MVNESDLLTVEEVAERLGLSLATVRRRCASGTLPARKVGKSWLIAASGVHGPAPTQRSRRRRRAASAQVDLQLALTHLRTQDLRNDIWVPDVLRNEDDLARPDELLSVAAARLDLEEAFDPATYIPVPKSPVFPRNAVDLSLPDRVAFQAVVGSCIDNIEAHLRPSVYSARKSTDARYFLVNGRDAWLHWRRDVIVALESSSDSCMAETDITAFFDFIKHELLLPELQELGLDHALTTALREMLRTWTVTPNAGLPQGPNASRALANFYMAPIDLALDTQSSVRYFRYMDDIRIVGSKRADVISALQVLDSECRRRGLALSSKKTQLLTRSAAVTRMEERTLDILQYAFDSPKTDPKVLRSDLRSVLVNALEEEGIDVRHARFSLGRLFRLRDDSVLRTVLENLEALTPLREMAPRYLSPWLRRSSVQRRLSEYLHNPERNSSVFLSTWLLALMLELRSAAPEEWINYARRIAVDRSQPSYHRAVALIVLGVSRHARDVARLEDVVRGEYDPEVVRGALVGLARRGKLTKPLATRARRIRGLESTLVYLHAARDFPSLLFPGMRAPIGR
jgi:excisionase family DNA binding protein